MHRIWAFWHFSSKTSHQKISAWVPGTHFMYKRVRIVFNYRKIDFSVTFLRGFNDDKKTLF